MIRDRKLWNEFEQEFIRHNHQSLTQKFRILEALHECAVALNAWPPKDVMEGLEADIRVARVVNSRVRITSEKDRQPS